MVYFVGAGTGAADLITVRGMRLLAQADVIVYTGSLINPELLSCAADTCRLYNSAQLTLEEVIGIISGAEAEGKTTVRLHTGDQSIYGAVREQMDALDALGIAYESCPGVSACFGAAASLNLEYTLPGVSQSLIITRMEGRTPVPEKESIERLAAHQASMAVYLSAGMLEELGQRLIAGGYDEATPAALVYKATWPEEEAYICTVGTLAAVGREHAITRTAIVLVGEAVAHRQYRKSRLYAADFATAFRQGASGGRSLRFSGTSLSVISFTRTGLQLSGRIQKALGAELEIRLYTKYKACGDREEAWPVLAVEGSVGEWAGQQLREQSAVLFIGACGIAVRAVAPFLKDKRKDAPVLAADERGSYVIPILSGHIGGANALAYMLAEKIGAQPVITTATDINGKFAVDVFAKENGFSIEPKEGIVKVSAKILDGEAVTVSAEKGYGRGFWENGGMRVVPYPPAEFVDIVVTSEEKPFDASVVLRPREYVLGIGCKRGKPADEIARFIEKTLRENAIRKEQVFALASVLRKKDEAGITAWCRKERVPFLTYTAEALQALEGAFTQSAFVKEQVGVDNVCERAALKACGAGGELIVRKCAENGMTIAIARRKWDEE